MGNFNFDFSFVRSGPPVVTLSAIGIAFNSGSRSLLGFPQQVDIGYDAKSKVIGVCAHKPESLAEPYEFESREKDGWVRINAKEFSRYLEQQTGMLIVILDEDHLKLYKPEKEKATPHEYQS